MANPKSNIYPIQLQGAELCLNRYDAEIKQYSGFNKNNSPYVGGCLSNLFTKDETVGTPDTTYIDKNGDVYTVNSSGLYKNDEKVIDYVYADFFDIENMGKNAFPENVVYVYDENLYITLESNHFIVHIKDPNNEFINYTLYENFVLSKLVYYSFHIKKYKINNSANVYIVGGLFYFDGSVSNYITVSCVILEANQRLTFFSDIITTGYSYKNKKNIIVKKYSSDNSGIIFAIYSGVKNCIYQFDVINEVLTYQYDMKIYNSVTYNPQEFPYKLNYCFTEEKFVYESSNNTYGDGFYKDGLQLSYTLDINPDDGNINLFLQLPSNNVSTSRSSIEQNAALVQSWGIISAARHDTSSPAYMIDDEVTIFGHDTGVSYLGGNKLENNMGGILNRMVLVNNNTVSGIALPGGWILACEWNSVDENHIYFGENYNLPGSQDWARSNYYCLWKDINTGDWYKLKNARPKLKEINGQIVINANSLKNSYRISDGKTLLFAPAWNNRRPSISNNTIASAYSDKYIATSINEYSIADNSSLILNPVIVTLNTSIRSLSTVTGINFIKTLDQISVNCYETLSDNNISYVGSFAYEGFETFYFYLNEKLKFLPFPTTTDGNVQYSPSLFADFISNFGNDWYIKYGSNAYQLMKNGSQSVMSFYLGTLVEDLEELFIIQGQYYGVINNCLYSIQYSNGLLQNINYICSVLNLQFCGATPYQAIFFSKTNRTLYSFTGANILQVMQPIDNISEVISYKYNPATQSIFLLTNAGVIVNGLFGMFQIAFENPSVIYLLTEGFVIGNNAGQCKYVRYYPAEDYTRENIELETCYYGSNDTLVLVNDCLYLRLFSEEKESGEVEISATTLTNEGKTTERTTFKIKASDWDDKTDTVYLRYQPKEQRGLGISFKVNSPFRIAAMSVGTSADTILIDKVSKGAIINPQQTSSNTEW